MKNRVLLFFILLTLNFHVLAEKVNQVDQFYIQNQGLLSAKKNTALFLTVNKDGSLVMLPKTNPAAKNQLWFFKSKNNNDYYDIGSVAFGNSRVIGRDHTGTTKLVSQNKKSNQYWRLALDKKGNYRLINAFRKSLDISKHRSSFIVHAANISSSINQAWRLSKPPTPLKITTTTIKLNVTSNSNSENLVKPPLPYSGTSGHQKIHVTGCQGKDCYVNRNVTREGKYKVYARCKAKHSKSLLLSNSGNTPSLPIHDCNHSKGTPADLTYFQSTQQQYELVSKYFVHLENTFIQNLKTNPARVLNYDSAKTLEALKASKGKVSYSMLEAFVYGELINSLLLDEKKRSPMEQAAVDWLVRGAIALDLRIWKQAQAEYRSWYNNPCKYKPLANEKGLSGELKETLTWGGMRTDCYGSNALTGVFKLGKSPQAHPAVSSLLAWGAYKVGKEIVGNLGDAALLNRAMSLDNVNIIGAGAGIAAATAAAAGATAIAIATPAVFAGSTSAAVVAAGGIHGASAGWVAGGITAGAGTAAGAGAIVVIAVAGTAAAIAITVEDSAFHKRMNTGEYAYRIINKDFKVSKVGTLVDFYSARLQGKTILQGPLAGLRLFIGDNSTDVNLTKNSLELAFADAMSPGNYRRYLPVTVPTSKGFATHTTLAGGNNPLYSKGKNSQQSNPLYSSRTKTQQNTVTAAFTYYNGATYLFNANGTYSKYSKGRTNIDKGYPAKMPGGWQGLPSTWHIGINAAMPFEGSKKAYMFKRGKYVRLNGVKVDKGYPMNMPGGWKNIPKSWKGDVDAAFYYAPAKKHYFFKGNEYVGVKGVTADRKTASKLPGGWKGMPAEFAKGIDAATFRAGHAYMFKGDKYIRFTGLKVDRGYPKPIKGNWPK